jgi:hypothetical protein
MQPSDLNGVEPSLATAAGADQAGIAEDAELVGDGGLGHLKANGESTGCALGIAQALQYGPARGISQGPDKHGVLALSWAIVLQCCHSV